MECKQCGHYHERVWFEPVMLPMPLTFDWQNAAPVDAVCYKRWACEKCGRYHFPDGSLYSNPYASDDTPETDPCPAGTAYHSTG